MNQLQRTIAIHLFKGDYLLKRKNHKDVEGYMLYTGIQKPVVFIDDKHMKPFNGLLKQNMKTGRRTINLNAVRQLDGRKTIKKLYKTLNKYNVRQKKQNQKSC